MRNLLKCIHLRPKATQDSPEVIYNWSAYFCYDDITIILEYKLFITMVRKKIK